MAIAGILLLTACVPAKKYNDLLAREQKCSEELETYKKNALDYEGKAKDLEARYDVLKKEVATLKSDTSNLGNSYRMLQTQYDKMVVQNESLEKHSTVCACQEQKRPLPCNLNWKQKTLSYNEKRMLS